MKPADSIRVLLVLGFPILWSTLVFSQTNEDRFRAQLVTLGAQASLPQADFTSYLMYNLAAADLSLAGQDVASRSTAFWDTYGGAWGLQTDQLQLVRETHDRHGGTHRFYQQLERGVPVLGAELALHFDPAGQLRSAGGFFVLPQVVAPLPLPDASITSLDFGQAAATYLKHEPDPENWTISSVESIFVAPYLIDPRDRRREISAYRLHLTAEDGIRAYELLVDAESRHLIFALPLHCSAMDRRLYNNDTNLSNLVWEEGDDLPGFLNTDQQELLRHTEQSYNLFFRTFGRDSYDDQGATMNIVYDANSISNCPNANAGSDRTNYCIDVVADDVTAHEWTHVYIFNTSRLIYAFESGAVNEGYADIFGEVVDLINGTGNDAGIQFHRATCIEGNTRWKIGEDLEAFSSHLRDMAFPNCRNDPDDRSDGFYYCGTDDDGGVHINSGLVNRTFVLLTDGGVHNGVRVEALGMTKAAHIFSQAMFNYTTRVTDFHAFADQLRLAGQDLLGQDLPELTTLDLPAAFSGEVITQNDLYELDSALLTVEFQIASPCDFETILQPNSPELCFNEPDTLFSENWEAGLGDWISQQSPVDTNTWQAREWTPVSLLPDGRIGQGMFGPTPFSDDCLNDLQNGTIELISPPVVIPETAAELVLSFDHYLSMEEEWDGGLLYLRQGEGDWQQIQPEDFIFNGYNMELLPAVLNNNPDAGNWAFSGADANSTTGSWGTSQVDLSAAGVMAGETIQLAWHLSSDGCNGWLGWYLDDIELVACAEQALPVELIDFSVVAAGVNVQLQWATAGELDNAGFWIERSSEGQTFQSLSWVNARGLAGAGADYRYTDFSPGPGVYFYRLRQVDRNGMETLGPVRSVSIGANDEGLQIAPNPARDYIQLEWTGGQEPTSIEIYDLSGRVIQVLENQISGVSVPLNALRPGVYYLRVGDNLQKLVVF